MTMFMPLFNDPNYGIMLTDMRLRITTHSMLMTGRLWAARCDFSEMKFTNAFMQTVRFENCNLAHVDFTGATLYNVIFDNCNLLGAKFDIAAYDAATRESLLNGNNQLHKDVRWYITMFGSVEDDTFIDEEGD